MGGDSAGPTAGMFEASSCLMVVLDARSGEIRAANRVARRLMGGDAGTIVGRPAQEVLGAVDGRGPLCEAFSEAASRRLPMACEATVTTAAGDLRSVVWSGEPVAVDEPHDRAYVVLTGIDVTTERAGSGLLNHVMRAATTTALVGADLDGVITFLSAGAEVLLGYSAAEMIGRPIPADTFASPEFLALTADQPERYATRDWEIIRKDGSRVTASVTVRPLTHSSGERIGYLGVAHDVTDERRSQALLRQALDTERLAIQRLAEVDRARNDLITTISHELRTPLTSIAGYSRLLVEGYGRVDDRQARHADAIRRNADRLTALVDELLTVVGLDDDSDRGATVVDLRDVIADVHEDLAEQIGPRGGGVRFNLPDQPVHVEGRRSHLYDIVWHLMDNALKCTTREDVVRCMLRVTDGGVELEVADTGFGIPAHEQERVFTRFFRTSTSVRHAIQGAGMGLAIVEHAVRRLGGEVTLQSVELAGATFRVCLPAVVTHRG